MTTGAALLLTLAIIAVITWVLRKPIKLHGLGIFTKDRKTGRLSMVLIPGRKKKRRKRA